MWRKLRLWISRRDENGPTHNDELVINDGAAWVLLATPFGYGTLSRVYLVCILLLLLLLPIEREACSKSLHYVRRSWDPTDRAQARIANLMGEWLGRRINFLFSFTHKISETNNGRGQFKVYLCIVYLRPLRLQYLTKLGSHPFHSRLPHCVCSC